MPAQTVLSVQEFLTKYRMTLVSHPPYSPNLTPSDIFLLFLWLKKILKGKNFADMKEVKQKMSEALKGINIDEFKNWAVEKNVSIDVLHQMDSTLKVTEV